MYTKVAPQKYNLSLLGTFVSKEICNFIEKALDYMQI